MPEVGRGGVAEVGRVRSLGPWPGTLRSAHWTDGGQEAGMSNGSAGAAGGGILYSLGVFGAWVWFFQQADGFWAYVLAAVQGVFWPAFMVYEVFRALAGGG